MSTNLTDKTANILSDLSYLADKLGQINGIEDKENLGKIFFEDDGSIKAEIKADSDLHSFAQKINSNKEKK